MSAIVTFNNEFFILIKIHFYHFFISTSSMGERIVVLRKTDFLYREITNKTLINLNTVIEVCKVWFQKWCTNKKKKKQDVVT